MKRFKFSSFMLVAGLLFIYLPMVILVIYSFNASKLVTVWGGWSMKWYFGLLDNTQLIGSVLRSLEIAVYTAISSVILGTLAAFVLTRIPRFKGMHRYLPTLMKLQGATVAEMPVNHRERHMGVSKYGNWERAVAGIRDLFGVRWLQDRHFGYEIREKNR